ncbi:MAG: dephospho-CoA kinase [Erysipelotrichaceae bacterium]|nr:MAG: dephospho-CoA [Erysipelotrichaceae bacterium]TXT18275.1 MAG: dephospho-CoA kinase [Erysipelotrichaceae bacterium]
MHIAITGNIGSGKSSVSRILRSLGYPVFDADSIAKAQYEKAEVKAAINDYFHEDLYKNGVIDPACLSQLIFQDTRIEARQFVEALIHPLALEDLNRLAIESKEPIVFSEVPLLYESHGETNFDRVLLVTCDDDVADKRLMEQRGLDLKEIRRRRKLQLSPKIKAILADDIIENNDNETSLVDKVSRYSDKIRSVYGKK